MRLGSLAEQRALITDLRDLPADAVLEADVCIIGGGAAGITLALQFVETRQLHVVLLEAGGLVPEAESQHLYAVDNAGELPVSGMASRLRFFGGTTNHWDGRCAPLDEADFQTREWVPHSGWPISRQDLDEHYARALDLVRARPDRVRSKPFSTPCVRRRCGWMRRSCPRSSGG